MNRQSTKGFYSSEHSVCIIMVDISHYSFIQTHKMYTTNSEYQGKLWTLGDYDVSM